MLQSGLRKTPFPEYIYLMCRMCGARIYLSINFVRDSIRFPLKLKKPIKRALSEVMNERQSTRIT